MPYLLFRLIIPGCIIFMFQFLYVLSLYLSACE